MDSSIALFAAGTYTTPTGQLTTYHLAAEDRLRCVRSCTHRAQLRSALRSKTLQGSVRTAIERRLRQLDSAGPS